MLCACKTFFSDQRSLTIIDDQRRLSAFGSVHTTIFWRYTSDNARLSAFSSVHTTIFWRYTSDNGRLPAFPQTAQDGDQNVLIWRPLYIPFSLHTCSSFYRKTTIYSKAVEWIVRYLSVIKVTITSIYERRYFTRILSRSAIMITSDTLRHIVLPKHLIWMYSWLISFRYITTSLIVCRGKLYWMICTANVFLWA